MGNLIILLLQVVVICSVARAVGWIFEKLKQPRVVGEMVAGLLLGASFLGWIAPSVTAFMFHPQSLGSLKMLSQLGLMLFMFQVGGELNLKDVLRLGRTVVAISYVGILIPFASGAGLALYLYKRLSPPGVPFLSFALFMGIAMSITAFPVLARILVEKGLLQTRVGSIALASAAIDDVTAWCLLALLSIQVASGAPPLFLRFAGLGCYVALMLIVRYLLGRSPGQVKAYFTNKPLPALLFMFASALVTSWLGIHVAFGAFVAGIVLPKQEGQRAGAIKRIQPFTTIILLPLFFALTGLRTHVLLMDSADLWLYCGLIILVAVFGKLVGCAVSGRISGMNGREALALGILMNTRGLVELIILNVGLDLHIISPALFSMMVLMALFTTIMTGPLLEVVYSRRASPALLAA